MYKFLPLGLLFLAPFLYGQNKINAYEYWFDANYAGKLSQSVSPAEQYALNTLIPASSLSEGLHTLNLRFRDDSARYSSTISQFFYKVNAGSISISEINAYQYWFDNDFVSSVLQPVSSSQNYMLNAQLSASSLTEGLHILNVRFRDNSSQWSSTISQFFYKAAAGTSGGNNLVNAYQYWFDSQFSVAQLVPVTPVDQLNLSAALPTATLTKGLHVLNMRFRDAISQWSSTISQFVYVSDLSSSLNNKMKSMQYWFDTRSDSITTKAITTQQVVQVTELLNASTLADGLHTLHVRFADSVGQFSSTLSQFFYKSGTTGVTTNVVTGYRYWFNDDDASKMVLHTTPSQSIVELNTKIDLGCLTSGANRLHIQFLDQAGMWSVPLTDTISVLSTQNIYRFTGNGNWSNAANWVNNAVPALDLPGCKEIIIDHISGGTSVMDLPQFLLKNARLTVLPGKTLVIPDKLQIK